jgi:hypothetical protein
MRDRSGSFATLQPHTTVPINDVEGTSMTAAEREATLQHLTDIATLYADGAASDQYIMEEPDGSLRLKYHEIRRDGWFGPCLYPAATEAARLVRTVHPDPQVKLQDMVRIAQREANRQQRSWYIVQSPNGQLTWGHGEPKPGDGYRLVQRVRPDLGHVIMQWLIGLLILGLIASLAMFAE